MIKLICCIVLVSTLSAKHLHSERFYQEIFCDKIKGKTEVVLSDKSRIDCLTDEHAIEVDFAVKFKEAIGQALYYSVMSGKKPAVYLIIEKDSDLKYLKRLKRVAEKYKIEVFYDR